MALMTIHKATYDVAVDDKASFIAKVFEVSEREEYENNKGEKRSFFKVVVADATQPVKLKIYKSNMDIKIGRTYKFINVVRKFGGFWFVNSSTAVTWSPLSGIPKSVEDEALNALRIEDHRERNLKEALEFDGISKVSGKVVQVSPLKFVRSGELPMKFLSLKDTSCNTVKVALFKNDAETEYKTGDVISITDVFRYKDTETLSTKTTATVEFLNPEKIPVNITDIDHLIDEDFNFDKSVLQRNVEPSSFEILGIERCVVYDCCDKIGCKKKKLINKRCPYCKEKSRGKFGFAVVYVKHDEVEEKFTLFYNDLEKLLEFPENFLNEAVTNEDLMEILSSNLPYQGKAMFDKQNMSLTTIKRKIPS